LFSLCIFSFILFIYIGCKSPTAPKEITTAPDTTSHNWTFQTFYLGGATSSSLSDVAIINDTLAYAVGSIYTFDSTGTIDQNAYNLVKWNGSSWKLLRIQFYSFCGQQNTGSYRANSVLAFGDSEIWIASNNSEIAIWNGNQQIGIECLPVSVSKMWASNNKSVYTVGALGQIGHYANGTWQKIISGTTLDFLDIYGATDSKTGKEQILAVASKNNPSGIAIFSIQNNTTSEISYYPIKPDQVELYSIWFVPNNHYYVVGNGIYEKNALTDTIWKNGVSDITRDAATKIRGNALNDVFVVGSFGEFLHWNGASWKSYIKQTGLSDGSYAGIAVKGNLVIAVGANNNQAVITVGKRN
jgi:hypothetical protein